MVGRARLVGFEERDRDCCFHSVTVRVDMMSQTYSVSFVYFHFDRVCTVNQSKQASSFQVLLWVVVVLVEHHI